MKPHIPYPYLVPTGQVTSYADGDDGWYQTGRIMPDGVGRFEVLTPVVGQRVVVDKLTGLTWAYWADIHDLSLEVSEEVFISPEDNATFLQAVEYTRLTDYAGRSGFDPEALVKWNMANAWRLPNINEVCSLYRAENVMNNGGYWGQGDWMPPNTVDYVWTSTFDAEYTARNQVFRPNRACSFYASAYVRMRSAEPSKFVLVTGGRFTALE
jgi:hypothetical protein